MTRGCSPEQNTWTGRRRRFLFTHTPAVQYHRKYCLEISCGNKTGCAEVQLRPPTSCTVPAHPWNCLQQTWISVQRSSNPLQTIQIPLQYQINAWVHNETEEICGQLVFERWPRINTTLILPNEQFIKKSDGSPHSITKYAMNQGRGDKFPNVKEKDQFNTN